ncbi:MAG: carbohydrate binding family 9 domain-containing protein [Bacteroidia bacterium]|nr:carbohydrate binding family 9 domain-containing protein [Bacteroidia bacterium]
MSQNKENFVVHIKKGDEKIILDGELKEQCWQSSDRISEFWKKFPNLEKGASPRTELSLTYDHENLYIGVICFTDKEYIIQTLKRDKDYFDSDAFGFVLDPVNRKTHGYMFGVNAMGVRTDAMITSNSRDAFRPDWDNKWFSAVKHYKDHWSVEFAIPFKTLRYESEIKEWGINFIRNNISNNEYHTWAPVPLQFDGIDLGYLGTLKWEKAPAPSKGNVTLIPYATGEVMNDFDGNTSESGLDVGIDAKIALSSSLNPDLTINPDFSQIEVDESLINLTRFNIRLPEKRTFFLENDDIFSDFGSFNARPFFSRRVGLNDDGEAVPIDYGIRLSGNMTESLRVGLFNAQQHKSGDDPAQNYTAIAIHKRIFDRSNLKAFFTNRQATENMEFVGDDYGRNAGLEFSYVSKNGEFQSWAGYNKSYKPGYNDEDGFVKYGIRYNSRTIRLLFSASNRGTNYYTDLGFSNLILNYDAIRDTFVRLGTNQYYLEGMYSIYPGSRSAKINRHRIGAENFYVSNTDEIFSENIARIKYFIEFNNRNHLQFRLNAFKVNLRFPFGFTDDSPLPVDQYDFESIRVNYNSDSRRKLMYSASLEVGSFYNGNKVTYESGIRYRAQPWGNFEFKIEYNDLSFPDIYGRKELVRLIPRIEINFSKNLFWTTFIQYNSGNDAFGINSRLQWRFKSMSDIFIVFNDNRSLPQFNRDNRAFIFKLNYWINP